MLFIFLIFVILGCQKAEVSTDKDMAMDKDVMKDKSIEKMSAMNVISYDSDKVTVVIDELAFLPPFIHIKPGTTVTWINKDKVEHTVAWHNKETPTQITESSILKTESKYSYTFSQEGIYDYVCGIHPFMHGGIIVGNPPEFAEMMEFAEDTPPPKVFSITPNKVSVNGGEKVIVKGENLVKGVTVFFHHLFGEVKFIDSKTLEVITPKHFPLKMDIIITNPDGDHFTLPNSFEFVGSEEPQSKTVSFEYEEKRTPHFTASAPKHGDVISQPSTISISFNYPIVKGSNVLLYDLKGNQLAEGTLVFNKLGLEITSVRKLEPGIYKVTYHAVWLGGSAHDGEFYFRVVETQEEPKEQISETTSQSITIADFKFSPSKIQVKKGTKIIWTNKDKAPHTVTADNVNIGPNSNILNQNDVYSYTFDKTGTFTYYCKIHPSMRASVEVIE